MRKKRVVVIQDRFAEGVTLLAFCADNRNFLRITDIISNEYTGKGRCVKCLVSGIPVELWQEYELDFWYIWVEDEYYFQNSVLSELSVL